MTKPPPFQPGSIIGRAHLMSVKNEATDEFSVLKSNPKATAPSKTALEKASELAVVTPAPPPRRSKRPDRQQVFQENEILRVMGELKLKPKSLPKRTPGKPWVKSDVRQKLNFTVGVFDKAWERLRRDGHIKES